MKKLIIALSLLCFLSTSAFAQVAEQSTVKKVRTVSTKQVFTSNESLINLGIGLNYESDYNTTFPPISISYEYGLLSFGNAGTLGIGAYMGYVSKKHETIDNHKKGSFILAGRAAYHYTITDNFEVNAGTVLGYGFHTIKYDGSRSTDGDFDWSFFVGCRYMFNSNLGAFAELGYGISFLNVGLTFRL